MQALGVVSLGHLQEYSGFVAALDPWPYPSVVGIDKKSQSRHQ
jgi:hypothetical protein